MDLKKVRRMVWVEPTVCQLLRCPHRTDNAFEGCREDRLLLSADGRLVRIVAGFDQFESLFLIRSQEEVGGRGKDNVHALKPVRNEARDLM